MDIVATGAKRTKTDGGLEVNNGRGILALLSLGDGVLDGSKVTEKV